MSSTRATHSKEPAVREGSLTPFGIMNSVMFAEALGAYQERETGSEPLDKRFARTKPFSASSASFAEEHRRGQLPIIFAVMFTVHLVCGARGR